MGPAGATGPAGEPVKSTVAAGPSPVRRASTRRTAPFASTQYVSGEARAPSRPGGLGPAKTSYGPSPAPSRPSASGSLRRPSHWAPDCARSCAFSGRSCPSWRVRSSARSSGVPGVGPPRPAPGASGRVHGHAPGVPGQGPAGSGPSGDREGPRGAARAVVHHPGDDGDPRRAGNAYGQGRGTRLVGRQPYERQQLGLVLGDRASHLAAHLAAAAAGQESQRRGERRAQEPHSCGHRDTPPPRTRMAPHHGARHGRTCSNAGKGSAFRRRAGSRAGAHVWRPHLARTTAPSAPEGRPAPGVPHLAAGDVPDACGG